MIKYNEEFEYNIKDKNVNIGIINGNNTIVLIIPGYKTNIYGYNNRYSKLANKINGKYKATVIITSNPFRDENPINDLMYIIEKYAKRFENYEVYFFGFSKGGLIGAQHATQNKKIKRMVLINGPLMIYYHRTKDGMTKFDGERITYIYGSLDPSYKYSGLLTLKPQSIN